MKKALLILLSTVSIFFTSCFSPVYYDITQDVPPEPTTVSGVISSIVRYNVGGKEFLVLAADNGLRYKNADDNYHSVWVSYTNLPFPLLTFDYNTTNYIGEQIIKVLADSEYLYILSTSYIADTNVGISVPAVVSIYAKKMSLSENGEWSLDGEWTKVASGNDDSGIPYFPLTNFLEYVYSDFNVFCTNSVQVKNRYAFIRSGNLNSHSLNKNTYYYALNGKEKPIRISATPFDDTNINCINSAAVLNNKLYFFNSQAVTTNETKTKDATYIYYGKVFTLNYTDGNTVQTAISNCGTTISCLAVTNNSLLIGRGDYSESVISNVGGLVRTSMDSNGIPGSTLIPFKNNAQIQLSQSYLILTLLNTDPSKNEEDCSLYSSIAFVGSGSSASASVNYNNIGLWSYYPSRGNWNRE